MFTDIIAILDILARAETGVTVGKIQKEAAWLTRGQAERILKSLIADNYVTVEKVPYRNSVMMNLYHITATAVNSCRMVTSGYERRMKQQTMREINANIAAQNASAK